MYVVVSTGFFVFFGLQPPTHDIIGKGSVNHYSRHHLEFMLFNGIEIPSEYFDIESTWYNKKTMNLCNIKRERDEDCGAMPVMRWNEINIDDSIHITFYNEVLTCDISSHLPKQEKKKICQFQCVRYINYNGGELSKWKWLSITCQHAFMSMWFLFYLCAAPIKKKRFSKKKKKNLTFHSHQCRECDVFGILLHLMFAVIFARDFKKPDGKICFFYW